MNRPLQPHPLHSTAQQPDPLSDSEKYTALIKHMQQGYCIIEVIFDEQQQPIDYRFLEVNPLFEQLTGLVDAVGKTMRQLQPAHEQHWFDLYGQVVKTGQSVQVEQEAAHLAGGVWYDVFAFPFGYTQRHQVGIFFTDRSERKQREQQQAFLLQFSDRLRVQPNPDAVANCALQLLFRQLGLDRCYIGVYRLEEDRGDFTYQVGNDRVPPVPDRVRLSDFPDALRVAFERTLVIDDIVTIAEVDRRNLSALGMGALVAVTLRLGENHPLWAIIVVSAQPRHWTPAEIRLIEDVTERTWAAIERAKAEEVLQQSEANYRTLFESMQEGYTVAEAIRDESGKMINYRFLQVNPAFSKLTGLSPQQTLGKTAWTILPGLDPKWFAIYQQVLDTGQPVHLEEYILPLNEWYALTAFWFAQEQFAMLFTKITERKLSEAALQLSEERFRLFVTASSDVVFTMSADWRQMKLLDGKPVLADTREPSRDWLLRYIPAQDRGLLETAIDEAIAHKRMFELEHRVIRADGQIGWTLSRAVPILDQQGQIHEWFGTASDVTKRRQAQEALRQSEARYRQLSAELEERVNARTQALSQAITDLQRSNDNLQQFAYVASHDLQEPLRKIQQFGDLLKTEYATQLGEGRVYLERMQSASARMSTLIRDLLTFSRISSQQESTSRVRLDEVVQNVLVDLELRLQETGAILQIKPLPVVEGNRFQLEQLFQNLLSNALKFHRPGVQPVIQLGYQRVTLADFPIDVKPNRVVALYDRIDLMDNGIGFDEKYVDRIFQVFQRLHGNSSYAGTGIGLAICEKVVVNHGGAITARSQPNQGSTFTVYLPA